MSSKSFTPGTRVSYNGGMGRPRVEVVNCPTASLVEIEFRGGRRLVVPAESLAFARTATGASSAYTPRGC